MPQSKYVKGSIIMEEKKKHIEIIIDINAAEHTSEVQLKVENVSARELVGSYISAAKSVAEAIEKNSDASKRHTFLAMAVDLFALSTAPDKED